MTDQPRKKITVEYKGGLLDDLVMTTDESGYGSRVIQISEQCLNVGDELVECSREMIWQKFVAAEKGEVAPDPPDHVYKLVSRNDGDGLCLKFEFDRYGTPKTESPAAAPDPIPKTWIFIDTTNVASEFLALLNKHSLRAYFSGRKPRLEGRLVAAAHVDEIQALALKTNTTISACDNDDPATCL